MSVKRNINLPRRLFGRFSVIVLHTVGPNRCQAYKEKPTYRKNTKIMVVLSILANCVGFAIENV
jgi:hypothetical protein